MSDVFTRRAIEIIKSIPHGRVTTYGLIAEYAENPRGARQVARILHSSSKKYTLPWHRVINRHGTISLKPGHGYEVQKELLEDEGVVFDNRGRIDLECYLWWPAF